MGQLISTGEKSKVALTVTVILNLALDRCFLMSKASEIHSCQMLMNNHQGLGSPTRADKSSDSAASSNERIGNPRTCFLCCWATLKVRMPVKGPHGFSWVQPAVYPLYAAVGVGILAACTIITRKLTGVSQVERGKPLGAGCQVLTHTTCQFLRSRAGCPVLQIQLI